MDKFELQKLRDLPIEGVAGRLGLTVRKHKALCPYHEDRNPSLSFHVSRNTFKCFVCGQQGGVIDLSMQVLGKDFKEACHWLADEHNIIVSCHPELVSGSATPVFDAQKYSKYFQHPFLNQAARTFLFTERKLHPGVIRWCRLTSWTDRQGTPWLQIPYYDIDGHLIGVQNRRLSRHPELVSGSAAPRFRFPRGSQCKIYNLPILRRLQPGEALYVAEGCSDCWALLSSGHKAVAIPSATLLKAKEIEVLKGLNLHMFPDADIPGEKLFLQLKAHCPQLVRHSLPTNCKDYSEYYANNH